MLPITARVNPGLSTTLGSRKVTVQRLKKEEISLKGENHGVPSSVAGQGEKELNLEKMREEDKELIQALDLPRLKFQKPAPFQDAAPKFIRTQERDALVGKAILSDEKALVEALKKAQEKASV